MDMLECSQGYVILVCTFSTVAMIRYVARKYVFSPRIIYTRMSVHVYI